jgi:hypothetical protein
MFAMIANHHPGVRTITVEQMLEAAEGLMKAQKASRRRSGFA